jgi:hypothetical protein
MLSEQEQKDVTLRVFVSPNDKLLIAITVFGGLTLLSAVITNELFYFVSLFMFCVLARELNSRFPKWRVNTIELLLFRILFFALFLGIIAYSSYFYFFSLGLLPFFLFSVCVYVSVFAILPQIKHFVHKQNKN